MIRKNLLKRLCAGMACGLFAMAASAQVTLNVNVGNRGAEIGDRHYGIFFEEINHAGDGGLYAELVRNRSFEDKAGAADYWTALGSTTMKIVTDGLLNDVQTQALEVKFGKAGDGVKNGGFWGMNMVSGRQYELTMWIKGTDVKITPTLIKANGTAIGEAQLAKVKDGANGWAQYKATLTASANDPKGALVLKGDKAGTVAIDVVSLFPPTYKNRPNGCRPDLAKMLEDMKPAFFRFPGGCFVEGTSRNNKDNRFEWKKTIGPIEERPGHENVNWNYMVSDGLGFHEMLVLAEDLGAEPLFVVNIGMGHGWKVDYTQIGEYIQEALDAIEYCNGDASTKWGAVRIAAGHPEPFNLRLLEIGNENYQADANQQSDHYAERYIQFYNAIHAKHPEIVFIGNVESWGTDNPTWRNPHPVDAVDEHYYRNPAWFANQYNKYDKMDRSKHRIYVGEYAVTSDFGTTGNLNAALGEAVYMLGMERNSDLVVMNSYAPIFTHEEDFNWKPDMIRFNTSECYGTPSYYVQQLMPNYHGKQNVLWTESGNTGSDQNKVGVSTWLTSAKFDNVKITDADGKVVFTDDFSSDKGNWTAPSIGTWAIAGGALTQTDTKSEGGINVCSAAVGDHYTLELDATKTDGAEGFLIAFNYADDKNYCWWNLGGWGNTNHAIEVCTNGAKANYDQRAGVLTTGKTYRVKIEVAGAAVKCYLDGALIHDITLPVSRKIYVASSIDEPAKKLYVKIVNTSGTPQPTTINLASADMTGGKAVVLASASGADENTNANQFKVKPAESALSITNARKLEYSVPAYSLNILEINLDNIVAYEMEPPTPEQEAQLKDELSSAMSKFNFLHSYSSLPTGTASAHIKWTITQAQAGYVDLTDGAFTQALEVLKQPAGTKPLKVATLHANATMGTGEVASIDYDVMLAPADTDYGYLYCFMNRNKEITNYALGSKEDLGMKFNVLLDGREIFNTAEVAKIEGGTRDAYMAKGQNDGEYFMVTTDMSNAKTGTWNNYGIDLLRSTDMIHWESVTFDFRKGKSIFSDPDATTDAYKTDAEYAKINRVWAPQFIWDKDAFGGQGAYLVYYSCWSTNSGDSYDKIYYSYTRDFKTLTQPRLFLSPAGRGVIDGDIHLSPYDGLYHMFYKWEGSANEGHGTFHIVADKLVGADWKEVDHIRAQGNDLVEGASAIRRINEDAYNHYYMCYSGNDQGYKVLSLDHAMLGASGSSNVQGNGAFQHGSILTLTQEEYTMLQAWSDLTLLLESVKAQKQATGSAMFDEAIAQAEAALAKTSVSTLAEELPKAIDALNQARCDYIESTLNPSGNSDLTYLIANADFSKKSEGWLGTSFTAAPGTVAEHWNKNFDTYQDLGLLPAGTYTFSADGFYRYGSNDNARAAHANGTEALLAMIYINGQTAPLMSLFDESAPYTYDPYNYPNNVGDADKAFNTNGAYKNNSATIVLPERANVRVGIKKESLVTNDWACFDNFKLTYDPSTGIADITADPNEIVDVYSVTGVRLRQGVKAGEAAAGLQPGIYIIGNKKVAVK